MARSTQSRASGRDIALVNDKDSLFGDEPQVRRTGPTEPKPPQLGRSDGATPLVTTTGDPVFSSEIAAAVERIVAALQSPRTVMADDQPDSLAAVEKAETSKEVKAARPEAEPPPPATPVYDAAEVPVARQLSHTDAAQLSGALLEPPVHPAEPVAAEHSTDPPVHVDASIGEHRAATAPTEQTAFPALDPLVDASATDAYAIQLDPVATDAQPAAVAVDMEDATDQTRLDPVGFDAAPVGRPSRDFTRALQDKQRVPGITNDWRWDKIRTAARYAGMTAIAWMGAVLLLIGIYRFVDPPVSNLMVYQWLTGVDVDRRWVPIDRISPQLVRAVIISEDGRFCAHNGIDVAAIEEAIENANDGIPRGASTISMQVIKNLFLWQSKSYVRKAIEVPLTLVAEVVWPKRRMLEIYLNIAEWGPGVFGAEAAAQHHFNKPAAQLGEREAAQLAASLPNPMIRDAGDPGPRTRRKASIIQARVRTSGPVAACVLKREPWRPRPSVEHNKGTGAPPGL